MSTRYDDAFTKGETWSLIVSCTDSDGNAVTPSSANWKLINPDGTVALTLTNPAGITIAGSVCSINVQTSDQTSLLSRTYRHRLKIVDSGGSVSRQVHGFIRVLPDDAT